VSNRTISLDERLYEYMMRVSSREPDVLRRLRAETSTLPRSGMQIAPEQGQFMGLLIRLMGAARILEIGTFTGYSTLCMALALPEEGRIITCDVSEEWTDIARRYWLEVGVADCIELRLAPALETLEDLVADPETEPFDFVFIDADKENYLGYYDMALELTRPGGLITVDNVLWGGSVADVGVQDKETVAIRELNQTLRRDQRVDLSLVPIGDGLSLARKR
jgi:caffeoyl-CoA O-methyltransferase